MKSYNIAYYADKIKNGEQFSLARWGDGELLCMSGRSGGNSNGCRYSPELREALFGAMNHKENFIYGMQRVLPQDKEKLEREYPHIDWYDTEVFSVASAQNTLQQFIEAVSKYPVTIIGNYSLRDATKEKIPHRWFMEVPPMNAFDVKDTIIQNILWEDRFSTEPKVYLFSCGMAANAIISELHGKVSGWLIDVGHIWDIYAGSKSRCDLI